MNPVSLEVLIKHFVMRFALLYKRVCDFLTFLFDYLFKDAFGKSALIVDQRNRYTLR